MSSTWPLPGTSHGNLKLTGIGVTNGNVTVAGDVHVVNTMTSINPLDIQGIYFNVRGVPSSFQEREPEMQKLTTAFQSAITSGGKKETNTLVICGAPGAGKTSLAASFVDLHGKELKDFHVLWIAADSNRGIRDQFVQACEHDLQGLSLRDKEGQLLKDEYVMSAIYNQLSSRKSLIIFDNAASGIKYCGIKEEIGEFFPKSVQPGRHHPVFLITTRTADPEAWKGYNKNMVQLGSFSWEDCWALMKKELPLLGNYEDGCRRLWEFFNGLPIAIEQAVNVMRHEASFSEDEAKYNPGEFVAKALAFQPTSLESIQGMDMELYERLNCLWDYSMELIRNVPNVGEFAIHVLDVMALLSSTGIPQNFLQSIIKGYVITENEGCETSSVKENVDKPVSIVAGILKKFSMVQKSEKLLYVHVLLQEHRRKYLKQEKRLRGHVVAIAESMIAIPELTSYMQKDEYAYNFENIDRVCNAILEYVQDEAKELNIKCAQRVADILPQTALDLLATVNDTFETLDIKSNCYLNLGNYNQALHHTQDWFNMSEAEFGRENTKSLRKKTRLANVLWKLGDNTRSLALSKEVHYSYRRILGEEHPDTLTAKNNLASLHSDLGNYAEALGLSKEVYDSYSRILGEEHPDTLSAKSNLASLHSDLGNYAEALGLSKEVYDSYSRILGEEHPNTLSAKSNLANRHSDLGNYAEALGLSKQVYDSRCRILGEEHPDTLSIKNNLANRHSDLGNYAEALGLSKEVYDSYSRILGEEHPNTLSAKSNLANRHSDLGNYAEALRLSKEVYDSRCRILGEAHPDTLSAKSNLASFHSDLGNYAEALGLSKEVYHCRCRILGEEHPDTLRAKNNMANRHSALRNYDEALVISKEVHDSYCRILGEDHPDTLIAKSNLANRHSGLGNYAEALGLSNEVYDSRCRILGEEHPDTLSGKNNLACRHSDLGNYAEALVLSKEVYDSRCRILGVEHPDTLSAKNNLAIYHSHLGNYAEALE